MNKKVYRHLIEIRLRLLMKNNDLLEETIEELMEYKERSCDFELFAIGMAAGYFVFTLLH